MENDQQNKVRFLIAGGIASIITLVSAWSAWSNYVKVMSYKSNFPQPLGPFLWVGLIDSILAGVIVFWLSNKMIKAASLNWSGKSILVLTIRLTLTVVGSLYIALVLIMLHTPSGH